MFANSPIEITLTTPAVVVGGIILLLLLIAIYRTAYASGRSAIPPMKVVVEESKPLPDRETLVRVGRRMGPVLHVLQTYDSVNENLGRLRNQVLRFPLENPKALAPEPYVRHHLPQDHVLTDPYCRVVAAVLCRDQGSAKLKEACTFGAEFERLGPRRRLQKLGERIATLLGTQNEAIERAEDVADLMKSPELSGLDLADLHGELKKLAESCWEAYVDVVPRATQLEQEYRIDLDEAAAIEREKPAAPPDQPPDSASDAGSANPPDQPPEDSASDGGVENPQP